MFRKMTCLLLTILIIALIFTGCNKKKQTTGANSVQVDSTVTDLQLALLNHISYKTDILKTMEGKSVEGHEELIDQKYIDNIPRGYDLVNQLKGYRLVDFDYGDVTGFNAAAYTKGDSIVLVYIGTSDFKDMIEDVKAGIFDFSSQDDQTKAFAKDNLKKYNNRDLYITGYSMGGRLCYIGTETAIDEKLADGLRRVCTFNGLGIKEVIDFTDGNLSHVHNLETKFADKTCNYVTEGDVVSDGDSSSFRRILGYNHVGKDVKVPCTNMIDDGFLRAHDLYSIIEYLWKEDLESQEFNNNYNEKYETPENDDNRTSEEITFVSSGDSYTVAAISKDSSLWMWGDNSKGAVGDSSTENVLTPKKIMTDVSFVKTNGRFTAAIKNDGSLWMWGDNTRGSIGKRKDESTTETNTLQLIPVKVLDEVDSVYFDSGSFVFAMRKDGSLWGWGSNFEGVLGTGKSAEIQETPFRILDRVKKFTFFDNNFAAIRDDNSLYLWGSNEFGEIGNGSMSPVGNGAYKHADQAFPLKILDDVSDVVLTQYRSAAIKTDGTLLMWGANGSGELGNGTIGETSPTPIEVLDNVKEIHLGTYTTAAIKNDGSLWMWGGNTCGPIGNGGTEAVTQPQKITEDVISVKLGDDFTGAIKSDGSLWMWGNNKKGLIGIKEGNSISKIGNNACQTVPTKILDNVDKLYLKFEYNISLQNNGRVCLWGKGRDIVSPTDSGIEIYEKYKLFDNAKDVIITRYDYIIIIDRNGKLWTCGQNKYGQLGTGDKKNSLVPVKVFG